MRSDDRGSEGMPRWVPPVVFAVTTVALLWPALHPSSTLGATDILAFGTPYRESFAVERPAGNPLQSDQMVQLAFVAEFWEALRDGDLQLWEPDVAAGVPLFTTVYNRLLAPWNLVYAVVPAPWGATAAMALGVFAGQAGTYLLARRLGLGRAGAMLAGVAYGISGPVTAALLRIHEVLVFPWWLLAIHGAATALRRRGAWVAAVAVATAATWLSGFPSGALFASYGAVAFAVVVAWSRRTPQPTGGLRPAAVATVRRLTPVATAMLLGLGLAAVQLAPTFTFLAQTPALDRSLPLGHRSPLAVLASAVSGRFLGAYQDGDWWLPAANASNPVEASYTMGAVALGLLVLLAAGWGRGRRRHVETLLARYFLPVCLVVLAGVFVAGPILAVLHALPFVAGNLLGRSRFLVAMGVAIGAGLALDRMLARRGDAPRHPMPTTVRTQAAVVAAAVGAGVVAGAWSAYRQDQISAVAVDLIVPAVALGVAAAALWAPRLTTPVRATVVTGALAGELVWGSFGFTPGAPADLFYPQSPAFDVIEDEVGPGGLWRFVGYRSHVLPSHAAAYLDLRDVRAEWPQVTPYVELIRTVDPEIRSNVTTAIMRSVFTDAFQAQSPILDAMAARYLIAAPRDAPLGQGASKSAPVTAAATPTEVVLPAPPGGVLRAARIPLRLPSDCDTGWVELEVGGQTSRRLLRTASEATIFAFPDLRVAPPVRATLRATHCPVGLRSGSVGTIAPDLTAELELEHVGRWVVYRRVDALPRVALARRVVRIDDPQRRLDALAERPPGAPVIVSGPLAPTRTSFAAGTARLAVDDPDRVVVDVAASGRGWLVLRDVAAPGWHAEIDGRPTPIVVTDHAFRGVEVPAGRSQVVFSYRPRTLVIGAWVSAGSLLAVVLLATSRWWVRRRAGARPGPPIAAADRPDRRLRDRRR